MHLTSPRKNLTVLRRAASSREMATEGEGGHRTGNCRGAGNEGLHEDE